jgi:hypothetical protein
MWAAPPATLADRAMIYSGRMIATAASIQDDMR